MLTEMCFKYRPGDKIRHCAFSIADKQINGKKIHMLAFS